jgi:hypothetical protein
LGKSHSRSISSLSGVITMRFITILVTAPHIRLTKGTLVNLTDELVRRTAGCVEPVDAENEKFGLLQDLHFFKGDVLGVNEITLSCLKGLVEADDAEVKTDAPADAPKDAPTDVKAEDGKTEGSEPNGDEDPEEDEDENELAGDKLNADALNVSDGIPSNA